jgi:hypothetical protein
MRVSYFETGLRSSSKRKKHRAEPLKRNLTKSIPTEFPPSAPFLHPSLSVFIRG